MVLRRLFPKEMTQGSGRLPAKPAHTPSKSKPVYSLRYMVRLLRTG